MRPDKEVGYMGAYVQETERERKKKQTGNEPKVGGREKESLPSLTRQDAFL